MPQKTGSSIWNRIPEPLHTGWGVRGRLLLKQLVIPLSVSVIVMRSLELQAEEERFVTIAVLQPVKGQVGVDVTGVSSFVDRSLGAVESRIKVLALSLHRHVLEVSLRWTFQVPFPHQKGFIARFQKLFGILWGIFVDAPVQSSDAVQVTVLTGKNRCPTRRTDRITQTNSSNRIPSLAKRSMLGVLA